MFVNVALLCLAIFILAGAADLFQAQYNSDELNNMGVQKQ